MPNRKLASLILAALIWCTAANDLAFAQNKKLFASGKKTVLIQPKAPRPSPDNLVPPPGEEAYFPVRPDGQPFLLNIDSTVNLTDALSGFYYDPKWRGEVWAPFDQVSLIEKETRKMSTWPEYDEANQFRILNGINKFLERLSGFGP